MAEWSGRQSESRFDVSWRLLLRDLSQEILITSIQHRALFPSFCSTFAPVGERSSLRASLFRLQIPISRITSITSRAIAPFLLLYEENERIKPRWKNKRKRGWRRRAEEEPGKKENFRGRWTSRLTRSRSDTNDEERWRKKERAERVPLIM